MATVARHGASTLSDPQSLRIVGRPSHLLSSLTIPFERDHDHGLIIKEPITPYPNGDWLAFQPSSQGTRLVPIWAAAKCPVHLASPDRLVDPSAGRDR